MFQYKKSVNIPLPVTTVFRFYTNIYNICRMVPDYFNMRVLQGSEHLKGGDIVKLQIKFAGAKFVWESAMENFVQDAYFTDRMIRGPFKSWEHLHLFEKSEMGTQMTDIIDYDLHFGPLGFVANKIFVRSIIDNIFTIRHNFDILTCRPK